MRTLVIQEKEELIVSAAQQWCDICVDAVAKRNECSIALSGGSTPKLLLTKLAEARFAVPWDKVHIFLVDERFVPFNHPDNNFTMIKDYLINHVSMSPHAIHPIPVTRPSSEMAARAYENDIQNYFNLKENMLPEFDLMCLGLGADGHIASLFPETGAVDKKGRIAVPVIPQKAFHERISLTLPVINNARNIMFLVMGNNKAEIISDVIDKQLPELPAVKVMSLNGETLFFIDDEAASLLAQ